MQRCVRLLSKRQGGHSSPLPPCGMHGPGTASPRRPCRPENQPCGWNTARRRRLLQPGHMDRWAASGPAGKDRAVPNMCPATYAVVPACCRITPLLRKVGQQTAWDSRK